MNGALSSAALGILQHSLGLDKYGRGRDYRNHFVTGPGTRDFDPCLALVEAGLMGDRGVHDLYGGDHCFTVTDAGRAAIREQSPAPPKLTPGQQRYRRFLSADCGYSFIEWLMLTGGSAAKGDPR